MADYTVIILEKLDQREAADPALPNSLLKMLNYARAEQKQDLDVLDETDLSTILSTSGGTIPLAKRRRADLVASTTAFRAWLVDAGPAAAPRKPLVHGDLHLVRGRNGSSGRRGDPRYLSALTRFCATLVRALRARPGEYVPLVFFCGSHVERDDMYCGGRALVCSLIAQLLRWGFGGGGGSGNGDSARGSGWVGFDEELRRVQENGAVDGAIQNQLRAVERGEEGVGDGLGISRLCNLFACLVRRLPRGVTVVCIVEGVSHYELDDYEDEMLRVVGRLLGLISDKSMAAVVKVLATSPTTTDSVQWKLEGDDDDGTCFLSLAEDRPMGQAGGMPRLWGNSDEDEHSGNSDVSLSSDLTNSDDSDDAGTDGRAQIPTALIHVEPTITSHA
ncbi:uncharacterized protein B0H64DRAFT_455397 [Chaetomium fimeti]|uniref:Uncharacterized protein n=1 Tax=Chaetomium fimeti TaxID=1854472 RepID=A0AAE0HPI3_9PEZI|nr:hypothetical protein B0H64DRAFT_455397 [Chaetomium fimeti]